MPTRHPAALAAATILLAACAAGPSAPVSSTSVVRRATAIATPSVLAIAISAVDMAVPFIQNAKVVNDTVRLVVIVPAGAARYAAARGYDGKGILTHSGAVTVNVPANGNAKSVFVAKSSDGSSPIIVQLTLMGTMAPLRVSITPQRLVLKPGGTTQLAATVRDAKGTIITTLTPSWATSNPSLATVDTKGVLHAVLAGSVWVTASVGGSQGAGSGLTRASGEGLGDDDPMFDESIMFARQTTLGGQQIYQAQLNGISMPTLKAWTTTANRAWEPATDYSSGSAVDYDDVTEDGTYQIYQLTAPAQSPTLLTSSGVSKRMPALSPNGPTQRLAYADTTTGTWQIWTLGSDGRGAPQQITRGTGNAVQPSYSPDGSALAFAADGGTSSFSIVRSDPSGASGMTVASLGNSQSAVHPTWSPSGATIAFAGINAQSGAARLYKVPAMGGTIADITPSVSSVAPGYYDPAWSKGGALIACTAGATSGGTRIVAVDSSGMFVMSVTFTPGDGTLYDMTPTWRKN